MKFQPLLFILIFFLGFGLQAQVIQSAQHLELKKSSSYHTALAAADAAQTQLVVFAADKEKLTALRYNSVLFFTDSLITTRPDDYEFMAGHSFEGNKSVTVYWATPNYRKIQPVSFDFTAKTVTKAAPLEPDLKNENLITAFSDNNTFYIITLPQKKEEANKLKFYSFKEGKLNINVADFSAIALKNISNKEITINDLLKAYLFQKIDTRAFTTLPDTSSKLKFYVRQGEMIITLDHNTAYTHLITLNLNNYTLIDKQIPQPQLQAAGDGNSYLHEGRLYQLKANEGQIALSAVNLETNEVIKSYMAGSNDTISFKNSELVSQSGSQRPRVFKNTKKFLQRLSSSTAALSVYQTPDDILVTAGGVRNIIPAGSAILGAALLVAGGSEALMGEFFDPETQQLSYFEGTFDENFEHRTFQPGLLAIDHLSQFMAANERNMSLITIFPFGYDVIAGYYDAKAKQYVLRKFVDDDL